jgi:hypothetical protein
MQLSPHKNNSNLINAYTSNMTQFVMTLFFSAHYTLVTHLWANTMSNEIKGLLKCYKKENHTLIHI